MSAHRNSSGGRDLSGLSASRPALATKQHGNSVMARQKPSKAQQGPGQSIPDQLKPHLAHRFRPRSPEPLKALATTQPANISTESLFQSPKLPKPLEPSLGGLENQPADLPTASLFKSPTLPKPLESSLDGSELDLFEDSPPAQSKEVQAFLRDSGVPAGAETVPVTVLHRLLAQVSQRRVSATSDSHVQPRTPNQAGKTEQCSLNLVRHRVPRRNDDFEGSTPGSLGSLSTFVISDCGAGPVDTGSDVRNSIAPESMLQPAANGWTKSTWADEEATRDRIFQTDSYRARFIRAWAEDAAAGHLLVKDDQLQNWLCDIDTNTGRLVPPVQYGETMADLTKLKNKEHAWRRLNWTSNLLAHKKFERRGLINNTNGVEDGLMGTGENVQPAQLYAWEQPADTVTTPVIRETEIIQHPDEPKVACYLRPAIKSDMEGVMKIYNHEVAHGLQALDTEPLVVQDLEDLLKRNREMKMPFLVMVKGKYGGESHAPPARDEILGFSFLSVSQTGLTGSEKNTKSHMSARAHVYVHHEYRQKKIGFSLLDKLLSVVSTRYSTKRGCDFHDATDDPVYDSGTLYNKPRLFFKIYIQYMVRTKVPQKPGLADKEELDEDLGWVRRMLLDLRFVQKGRFEGIHRVPCRGDQLAIFLDAVVFEHECDDLVNMPTFPTKNTLI